MTISAVYPALAGLQASLASVSRATESVASGRATVAGVVELRQAQTRVDASVSVLKETLELEQELAGRLLDILV